MVPRSVVFTAAVQPKENMKWETMMARLCPAGIADTQRAVFGEQKEVRGQVIGRLSVIAKRRNAIDVRELKSAWVQALDHVYAVLRAVDEVSRLATP